MSDINPAVREYFSALGKRTAEKYRDQRGSEYFRKIAAMRKRFGRLPKAKTPQEK